MLNNVFYLNIEQLFSRLVAMHVKLHIIKFGNIMSYLHYCTNKSLICTTWLTCVYFLLYTYNIKYMYSLRKKFTVHAKRNLFFCQVQVLNCNVFGGSRRIVHQVKICQGNSWPTKVYVVMFYSGLWIRANIRKTDCHRSHFDFGLQHAKASAV